MTLKITVRYGYDEERGLKYTIVNARGWVKGQPWEREVRLRGGRFFGSNQEAQAMRTLREEYLDATKETP